MEPLDNPIWHALTGPQAEFSQGSGLALRYDPEVSVFAGLPDHAGPDAWDALRTVVGPGEGVVLMRKGLELPEGWEMLWSLEGHQYVGPDNFADSTRAGEFVALGNADVPEMLALVERTKPGPFVKRTVELGPYLGLRDDAGNLVAMAGIRMRPAGYAELSAVCTDDAYRGRGLATALMRVVAAQVVARGEQPILHVASDNTNAILLYEHLGFTRRLTERFTLARTPY